MLTEERNEEMQGGQKVNDARMSVEEESGEGEEVYGRADDPEQNKTDEFDVSITTEGSRYILRPIRRWKTIMQLVSSGELSIQEAVNQTHFRLGMRAISGQEEATPDEGWSGYVSLLQAKWMTAQRTKQDVMICADIRNREFRSELSDYITKIANGHREMMVAAQLLVKGDKCEQLRADKQYCPDMDLLPAIAGHVAWFQREVDTLWLVRTTQGDYEKGLSVRDVEEVLTASKIGMSGLRHYILAGPSVFEGGLSNLLEEHFNDMMNNNSEAGKAALRAQSGFTQRRRIELLSEEGKKEATRMFICNIPIAMKRATGKWQKDLNEALSAFPAIKVNQKELYTAMQTYVDTIDGGNTFGIITKCEKICIGTGAFPAHFAMNGELREALEGERPKHIEHKVRTRYIVNLLTEEEAKQLPKAMVQCFVRGCSDEHEYTNFMRILISKYLLGVPLERLLTVQMRRHKIDAGPFVNETVIVVHATGMNLETQVREGNKAIGLHGSTFARQLEYGTLQFELVVGYIGVKGHVPRYIFTEKRATILVGIDSELDYSEVMDIAEQIVDLRLVAYWILRDSYLTRPRSLVLGLNTEAYPPIPDTPLLRKLVDVSKRWRIDTDSFLFREFRKNSLMNPFEEIQTQGTSGKTSLTASVTTEPQRTFSLKTYAAVVSPAQKSNDATSVFRQHMVLHEQRLQQQEQRLVQAEKAAMQLADRVESLVKEQADTRQQITNIAGHLLGQDERIVKRLLEALGGSGPRTVASHHE